MSGSPFYDPFNGAGKILKSYPDKVVWYMENDEHIVTCTQMLVDPILEANQRSYNESAGKRWGDGQIVASIPENIYWEKFAPAKKAGDDQYIKRLLNDSDLRKLRTFEGKV